jgi:hypothetical protein
MRVFAQPGWGNAEAPAPALPPASSWSRFDTPALKWQQAYGLLASAVILGLLFNLLIVAQSLSVPQRAAYAALLVLNAVGMAWVFEGKRWALGFEALRAALVFGALAAGLWFGPVSLPAQVAALFALALSWGMLALARGERAKLGLPLAGVAA